VSIEMLKGVDSQEKYGFQASLNGESVDFAPFDTREAAGKTAEELKATGIDVSDVVVVHTVTTAHHLVSVRKKGMKPPADQAPVAPVAEAPATETPRGRGRRTKAATA
jgi:hypothetical protein